MAQRRPCRLLRDRETVGRARTPGVGLQILPPNPSYLSTLPWNTKARRQVSSDVQSYALRRHPVLRSFSFRRGLGPGVSMADLCLWRSTGRVRCGGSPEGDRSSVPGGRGARGPQRRAVEAHRNRQAHRPRHRRRLRGHACHGSAAAPPHTAPTTTLSAPSGAGCGRPVRPRAGSRSPVSPRRLPARLTRRRPRDGQWRRSAPRRRRWWPAPGARRRTARRPRG